MQPRPPRDLFVFDDQTHIHPLQPDRPGNALRDIAEATPTLSTGQLARRIGR